MCHKFETHIVHSQLPWNCVSCGLRALCPVRTTEGTNTKHSFWLFSKAHQATVCSYLRACVSLFPDEGYSTGSSQTLVCGTQFLNYLPNFDIALDRLENYSFKLRSDLCWYFFVDFVFLIVRQKFLNLRCFSVRPYCTAIQIWSSWSCI